MKRITLATIKSFIRKNKSDLYIKNLSDFDPMDDCVRGCSENGFHKAEHTDECTSNTLGIKGAWFVARGARDSFDMHSENGFRGYRVYNCCGSFVIAVKGIPA